MYGMRELEIEGACDVGQVRRHGSGWIRAVLGVTAREFQVGLAPLRPPQASPCGGDCASCAVSEGDGLGINRQGEVR